MGVGNIADVATAIALGGPSAVFWMSCTGLVGMATKDTEASSPCGSGARTPRPSRAAGWCHFLREGIKGRLGWFLGGFFAIAGGIAAFGIGNMLQANTVAEKAEDEWGPTPWAAGLIVTLLAAAVILDGIKSIGRIISAFVPVMIAQHDRLVIPGPLVWRETRTYFQERPKEDEPATEVKS